MERQPLAIEGAAHDGDPTKKVMPAAHAGLTLPASSERTTQIQELSLPDMNCLKCHVVVMRRSEGIGRAAARSRKNLTWANGRRVGDLEALVCPACGGALTLEAIPRVL